MPTRLPIPGSDEGQWGNLLNEFLAVEHNTDGSLKKAADIAAKYTKPVSGIPAADIADGAITTAKLDAAVQAQLPGTMLYAVGTGIDPTGAADSTAALQAKIDEARTTGKPLYIGPGTYRLTATLNMRGAGLVVRGAGPYRTILTQFTNNIPVVRIGGQAQTIEELSVDYNTDQTSAQTNANGFEFYNSFFSTYRKLFAFRTARGFYLGTDATILASQSGANGVFSCNFETLEINGYAISAIDFTSTNTYSTGNTWTNVYTHNNYNGPTVANSGMCVNFSFCDEQVINQMNIEHSNPVGAGFALQQAKNVAVNGLHFEGLTPSTWGAGFVSLYDASKLMVHGVTLAFNTIGNNLGPLAAFRIGGGNCYLNCAGLNLNTNTVSSTGTQFTLVGWETVPSDSGTVSITEAELGAFAQNTYNDTTPSKLKNLNWAIT